MKNDWEELRKEVAAFRDARDWKQFHTPKNLAAAISIECAELQEHFLWCTGEESEVRILDEDKRQPIIEELADVMTYALLLADRLDVDMAQEIRKKMQLNHEKYPVEKSKGVSTKYTEL
jgi:dCTP diphosphatase